MKAVFKGKFFVISALFLVISSLYASSYQNEEPEFVNPDKKLDTVFFKLKFDKGDTLYYNVISHDSIVINYGPPLIKRRYERIKIVCDSVGSKGSFFLNQSLLEFYEESATADTNGVERTTSPWIGRKSYYEIDSTGIRLSYSYDDSSKAAVCPGGAFQPHLFFPLKEPYGFPKQSWIVETYDDLPENAVPAPYIRQSSMLKPHNPIDTLGEHCSRLEYIKTAQGSMSLATEQEKVKVTAILTGFGVLDISRTKHIPVHYYATLEQKLKIEPDGSSKSVPGKHFISITYTLDKYIKMKK